MALPSRKTSKTKNGNLPQLPDVAGVQSVEVGLRLLAPLMSSPTALSLKAISQAVGFAPPKAYRYLVSLARAGLVERLDDSNQYQLGPLAAEIGFAALRQIDEAQLGREAIATLSEELGVTTNLVLWTQNGPLIIAIEHAELAGAPFISIRVGSTLQITRSASGLVFLAFSDDEELASRIAAIAQAENRSAKDVAQEVEEVKAQGYAISADLMTVGLTGLAAPVFDSSGRVRFVLAAIFFSERARDIQDKIASKFIAAASRISQKLGASSATIPGKRYSV